MPTAASQCQSLPVSAGHSHSIVAGGLPLGCTRPLDHLNQPESGKAYIAGSNSGGNGNAPFFHKVI
jgi:hypothetical protein